MKKIYVLIILAIVATSVLALQPPSDSAGVVQNKKKNSPTIITRVHTMGLFLYMGKEVNNNPAADLYFNYTTKNGWGIAAFKVVDLNDVHSHNNFAFGFVSKTFHIGEQLVVAPYLGAGLEQQHSFASHGSDAMVQLMSNYKLNKKLSIEYIGIFNNIIFAKEYQDWTNRVRLIYNQGHWDVIGLFWHNNGAFDNSTYTSGGVSILYNRVPISNRFFLGAGLTSLTTLQSSNQEKIPTQTGIQFSTILTFK